MAERTVVDVHHPAPRDALDVDRQLIALVDVAVDKGREQVVGNGDGVEVTGEVEVHLLHRYDLGVATTRSATFDSECWAERRLAQCEHSLFVEKLEPLCQSDRNGCLAFAKRCGVDCGHEYVLGPRWAHLVDRCELDLRYPVTARLDELGRDSHVLCYVGDRSKGYCSGDF